MLEFLLCSFDLQLVLMFAVI